VTLRNHKCISLYGSVLETLEEGRTLKHSESTSVADDQIVKFLCVLCSSPLRMPVPGGGERAVPCHRVASPCECGKEPSRSSECQEFLD